MVSEPINVQRSVAVLIMMYNVQWWVKEEVMDKPCPGEDVGNDFPEEGMFAVHFHTASEEVCSHNPVSPEPPPFFSPS